jgi:SAM-dependent methyltransferase
MNSLHNENVQPFERDAAQGGYVYTTSDRLSCRLATQRSFDVILSAGQMTGRSVLDMGCGDGFYTTRFWDQGGLRSLTAVDAAASAIQVARGRSGTRPIRFQVADAHALPFAPDSFDMALVQSILHHDDRPQDLIREALRVAPVILIHEPNGNNLGLKIIEKLSRYHREHGEKSYSSPSIRRWVREAGGEVTWETFAGFVPMFSPDWLARLMKGIEPVLEKTPLLRALGCALYVLVARRK